MDYVFGFDCEIGLRREGLLLYGALGTGVWLVAFGGCGWYFGFPAFWFLVFWRLVFGVSRCGFLVWCRFAD